MRPPLPSLRARGSTLVLVLILLAVLSIIGVAAVSLGAQERGNASAKGGRDALFACASAARMQIWSELAKYGRGYFDSSNPPSSLTLPDGTILTAPVHYDSAATVTVSQVVIKSTVKTASNAVASDLTNSFNFMQGLNTATAYTVIAKCKDAHEPSRELEIEFVTSIVL